MDRLVERLAVGLSDATTRRDLLGRLCRAAIGIGIGVTALAGGDTAFATGCYQVNGGIHNSGNNCTGTLTGGCDDPSCPNSTSCEAGCSITRYWYCCCSGTLWECADCRGTLCRALCTLSLQVGTCA